MAILKIARMGHPVLRRRADEVPDPTAPEVRRLIDDMHETMLDAGGAGLAAPQVHVPLRVVMFHVPAHRAEGDATPAPAGLTVLINPVVEPLGEPAVEPLGEATAVGFEGCLSIPGMTGAVPRWRRVRYRGIAPDGTTIEREADGFHARVVQHECDHLDGILYPQRMTDLSTFGFSEEVSRSFPDAEGADRD